MQILRAAGSGVTGILCGLILASCGGGYGGSGSGTPPPTVTVSVNPTTITLGQSTAVTWSSSSAATCTASGGWSGSLAASGTQTVTPAAAGTVTFNLSCTGTGGGYGSGGATGTGSATLTVNAQTAYSLTNLVADAAGGTAANVDANLVNPWGISIPAGNFAAWVANNHTETSTLYDGNGKAQPHAAPLMVQFAASAGGTTFDPTGIVFNGNAADFSVTSAGVSGSAKFIFDGEGGMIAGWSPGVDLTHAITVYSDAGGAVYKGLAIAQNGGKSFLYATDFHNSKVDVFDASFVKQTTSATAFTFVDPSIPAGYAPFGIQAITGSGVGAATQIYVTYAQQQAPDNHDNANGAGLGYVDIYDTNGKRIKQLVAQGALNAPWGIVLAPADFGTLSNMLLVGNFGDGKINAYDPAAGTLAGAVKDSTGAAIATPGLWGIAFGNDADNQPHNTLFFAAGTNNEANGSYGRIDVGATPPVLNAPPAVTLTAPAGNLKGTVTLSATVKDSLVIAKVEFFANSTSIGVVTTAPYSMTWDTTTVADGAVALNAKATDADGNVGLAAVTATVANTVVAQVTLTQLQTQIFTPICSGCHSGVGTALPGVQNLTAGHTFASIVNVASIEQPTLLRIKPNDADNSYLVKKILGAAGIMGSRMPLGCGSTANPCLDQATIDMVKTWVNQGALDN
ncbi:MAG: TIGR03118 family protein [Gammaproteobacteria bacterium]